MIRCFENKTQMHPTIFSKGTKRKRCVDRYPGHLGTWTSPWLPNSYKLTALFAVLRNNCGHIIATLATPSLGEFGTATFTLNNMSTSEESQNVAVVLAYFSEFWGKGNPDIVDKLCADDFTMSYPMHGQRVGKEAAKQMLVDLKEVCTPLHIAVELAELRC